MRLFLKGHISKALGLMTAGVIIAATLPAANAHGPTRQKVTKTIEINAAPDKVWAIIKNFDDFSWHPAIEKSEGKGGNAEDATRTLTLKGGGVIDEVLTSHSDDDMEYAYRITKVDVKVLPVNNYSSRISVEAADGGKSTVTWKGAFYRGYMNNDPPEDLNDAAAIKAVSGVYEAGLEGLKKKVESGS